MATLGLAWTWPYWFNSWAGRHGSVGCGYGSYPGLGRRWWW
ncbi:hypothetical protein [Desulfosporosinus sp. OT]|nr:hypothetical protein [Desulfosporosinus sp. OT]